jgi:hypothetical protein
MIKVGADSTLYKPHIWVSINSHSIFIQVFLLWLYISTYEEKGGETNDNSEKE